MRTLTAKLIAARAEAVAHDARMTLGYPCANTNTTGLIPWDELAPLRGYMINQAGNPGDHPRRGYRPHLRDWEEEVLTRVCSWWQADYAQCWGIVTGGSSEAIGTGLRLAREVFPNGRVYTTEAAHLIARQWIGHLAMPVCYVNTLPDGAMDPADLERRVDPDQPVILPVTTGTTMTEAIDPVPELHDALDAAGVPIDRRYFHRDAALSGMWLPTSDDPEWRRAARLRGSIARDVDSMNVSGHKGFGTPSPCAPFVATTRGWELLGVEVPYLRSKMRSLTCSRSGQAVAELWLAMRTWDDGDLCRIGADCRDQATDLADRLCAVGVDASCAKHAMTVTFEAPPEHLSERYGLAEDGNAHVVCVPGKDPDVINAFVSDIAATGGDR